MGQYSSLQSFVTQDKNPAMKPTSKLVMFKPLDLLIPFEFYDIHPEFYQKQFEEVIKLPKGTIPIYTAYETPGTQDQKDETAEISISKKKNNPKNGKPTPPLNHPINLQQYVEFDIVPNEVAKVVKIQGLQYSDTELELIDFFWLSFLPLKYLVGLH